MQYQSSTTPNNIGAPANSARDQAIQRAIWEIMENNKYTSSPPSLTGDISSGAPSGSDWIQWAIANVSHTDFTKWAVVSGAYQSYNGNWQLDLKDTTRVQTFLVEVVPEPGFYGLLALGVVALGYKIRRRDQGRQAQDRSVSA
jgi:hypothetical protein